MNDALLAAYRETEYRVHGRGGFTLQIGQRCTGLASLHAEFGVASSAYVTAFNPFSLELTSTENTRRHEELRDVVFAMGLRFHEGIGQHPSNGWPGEDSLLILGGALEQMRALGAQFGQNAIVWAASDAVPQLLLLRGWAKAWG
jgi:hypothetical protein